MSRNHRKSIPYNRGSDSPSACGKPQAFHSTGLQMVIDRWLAKTMTLVHRGRADGDSAWRGSKESRAGRDTFEPGSAGYFVSFEVFSMGWRREAGRSTGAVGDSLRLVTTS